MWWTVHLLNVSRAFFFVCHIIWLQKCVYSICKDEGDNNRDKMNNEREVDSNRNRREISNSFKTEKMLIHFVGWAARKAVTFMTLLSLSYFVFKREMENTWMQKKINKLNEEEKHTHMEYTEAFQFHNNAIYCYTHKRRWLQFSIAI